MNHPFDLDAADLEAMDLDFEEQLTDEEAAQVGGGLKVTTLALGEEGGGIVCISAPCPGSEGGESPRPIPIDPPMTTLALGEESGGPYTKAWFECGGRPIYW
ncbi:hypothetical protein [Microcoleus sp. CAWBG58]|uniref:hypothetical protein n=1 Tax=Microcoleus sp. CAWBG58 TaxID=2841651 RepID=UPI0025F2B4B1|nr:hypothetical protein [Microcoleus sp. CAWBG58]